MTLRCILGFKSPELKDLKKIEIRDDGTEEVVVYLYLLKQTDFDAASLLLFLFA